MYNQRPGDFLGLGAIYIPSAILSHNVLTNIISHQLQRLKGWLADANLHAPCSKVMIHCLLL